MQLGGDRRDDKKEEKRGEIKDDARQMGKEKEEDSKAQYTKNNHMILSTHVKIESTI